MFKLDRLLTLAALTLSAAAHADVDLKLGSTRTRHPPLRLPQ